ncbi:esterase/lipase family protein [[Mycobacterium] zoologicum]|uniref:esterase/lipase family protein n=1 Tax=[Mycobacterium] zoologicum TaxID=2872311 RepID=UPI002C52BB1B|nr:alpha/beta hydrolase [Mycolicibacter sp. MYC101]MEB3065057.1 alpha/beta hydrolase [Mycolicibacter sp. MYC101]
MTSPEFESLGRPPVGYMRLRRQLLELTSPLEAVGYVAMRSALARRYQPANPHAVLVLPGGMGGDGSTAHLRWGLSAQGHTIHGWDQGRNLGITETQLVGLRARVDELYGLQDSPISVIGWSLGGLYARMLGRDRPEKIRQVITLGSPFRMLAHDRFAHRPFGRRNWERFVARHAAELNLLTVQEHERPPLTVPATSVYTRNDGFAPWHLSIDAIDRDAVNPRAENIAVRATHIGLASNPAVLAVLFDRLAQPLGQWRPFVPPSSMRRLFPRPATWSHPDQRRRSDGDPKRKQDQSQRRLA